MISPRVSKSNGVWQVHLPSGRLAYAGPTHQKAIARAHGIATRARRIRMRNDINRITEALARIEANR